MKTVSLADKFARFSDHWSPKLVGQVNGCAIKLVKLSGEFVWHHHDTEDEMFLVVKGRLRMKFRDGEQIVNPGEFIIVPHGVEHLPVAEGETEIMLVEPDTTLNTGNVVNERTVADLQHI
jgi:mannose-6-phosphate isomerase-like protein (cupin superfamily)